jgi:hypothetical protein
MGGQFEPKLLFQETFIPVAVPSWQRQARAE